eukprot:TRINITY_DN55911_c0_g1_i1.p1 TRINITY_DN55911_c0_g1~~TRINITY_DN55911_c0_g1_i1.p1  ORF type:complete len:180 (+),score=28.98 TRINITY_DN55911_c0_g1_i1:42-581(+)
MVSKLSDDQFKLLKEMFDMYDKKRSTGNVAVEEIGNLMRLMGANPTEAEIVDIYKEADEDGTLELSFQDFMVLAGDKVANARNSTTNGVKELKTAFDVLDVNQTNRVRFWDLRLLLTQYGDKLSEEDVDTIQHRAGLHSNRILDLNDFLLLFDEEREREASGPVNDLKRTSRSMRGPIL